MVGAAVRKEVERHALAAVGDGGDSGLGAVAGAAHIVEQYGVALTDGQHVIVLFRRDVARELEHIARGGGQGEGAAAVVAVITARTAVVIDLERLNARRDDGCLLVRRGHVDVETIGGSLGTGKRRGDGDISAGHGEGDGVCTRIPVYICYRNNIAAAVRYADAAEQIASRGGCSQGDHVLHLGCSCSISPNAGDNSTARCSVHGDVVFHISTNERHRQVEAGIVLTAVRIEVERHALAAAGDGGDSGLDAVAGAAHFIEQFGAAGRAAVIDGQFVIVLFRRDVARELEHIARGGGQGEDAAAVAAVVTARTAVVIDLERCQARRDGECLIARLRHGDVGAR